MSDSMPATPEPHTVEIDGSLYDAETGEFVRFVDRPAAFSVTDQGSAEWVLGRMLDAEASLAAVLQSPEVIRAKAVLANAESLAKAARSRIDSLHRRFDGELGEFARLELAGKKGRTLKTILGSISLKTVKGGLRVADDAQALAWARENAPGAIKTVVKETFQISALSDEERAAATEDAAMGYGFEIAPDRETVTVKTGVEA